MADADASGLPLEPAAGAAGSHATEAFSLLGNETRLAILLAPWEAYDPHGVSTRFRVDDFESVTRGFELMDALGMELVSEDPPLVTVTAAVDDDEFRLTFDDVHSTSMLASAVSRVTGSR